MHNHIGCIYLIFLHCAFSTVSTNYLPKRMQSHIGCICLIFLHCVFSNVYSNYLPERMHNYIGCIFMPFLHCAFSNLSSNCLPERIHNHIGCICSAFPQYVLSNVDPKILDQSKQTHIGCFFLLFASVRLRINPVWACMRRCIVLVEHWIPMLSISSERQRFYQSVRDLKQVSAISSWASEILRSVRDMYSRKKRAAKKLSL